MIGEGINRIDGPLKVTGRAAYSHDRREALAPLHAVILGAGIGTGRVATIETAAAESAPGVRLVMTHLNAPEQAPAIEKGDLTDAPRPQLASERILTFGQPVALVVADSFEQARAAAGLIEVVYETEPGAFDLATAKPVPEEESRLGNIEAAMAAGHAGIAATYTTPYHFANPIELHACIADWRDGHLTVYLAAQMISQLIVGLAETLLLDRSQVTVDSAFVGGGFGGKIGLHAEAVLASLAAMRLGRPVKLQLSRRQVFTIVGHRAATISRIRLAATADGRLTAIGHDADVQVSTQDNWSEPIAAVSRPLYAAPNRLTRTAHTTLDLGAAEPVRGPGELPGLMVFELAVDELAEALAIDPLELRLRNDTAMHPEKNVPFNGRRLSDCLREGAERFGWAQRPERPASRRDGRWLIGYGLASSIRQHNQMKSEVSVRLEPEGRAVVQSDMTDLGTGTYTIVAQVAAAALGITVGQVRVELARTEFPASWGSGGSWGSGNVTVATDRACQQLRDAVTAAAGSGYNDLFAEVRRHFPTGIQAVGVTAGAKEDPNYQNFSQQTYGASFAEVGVDADTGEVRLRRMLGVFAAGRILNAKTARSQMLGGMIWGISAALHEGGFPDHRYGAWVNGDLAEYLVPVHADIPDIEAILLDDFDEHANHLGVKGIGELGAGGTGGSVANAVYNATGIRVRDFPITIDKLLPGLSLLD